MSTFLFVSSVKLKVWEGEEKIFVQQHSHPGLAPHTESVADAIEIRGKLLLPPLGAQLPMQCRESVSPRCLLLISPPVQPLPVSWSVPTPRFNPLPISL